MERQCKNPEIRFEHICEVCGRREVLTPEEAFQAGWDYPPHIGSFGIISPRTCPTCSMMETAWAALVLEHKMPSELTVDQWETIQRINDEPNSIPREYIEANPIIESKK